MKKVKNSRFFLWFDNGSKTQVFFKKLLAVVLVGCMMYLAGYGAGMLVKVLGF